ncbi:MAG: 23S rRNA (guanosine(2251)-2'-O)-methyltransferase RlmB [Actinomycetota bacterium]
MEERTGKKGSARRRRTQSPGAVETAVVAGRRPVLELLKSGAAVQRILIGQGLAPSGTLGEIRRRAEAAAIPVRMVPRAQLDSLAGGVNHQGAVAEAGSYRYSSLAALLDAPAPALLFLDGVTDPHNLGSLLRSADGAGFTGLVLPSHRSVSVTPAVRKVSAGAAEVVPVARVTNLGRAIEEAQRAGVWIVGLAGEADADVWNSELMTPPLGLVLGAEDRGISKMVRQRCDELVKIPQGGRIGSLNVAVAGAVAMFEVARRREHSATL